jgi:dienelactone hydrolase
MAEVLLFHHAHGLTTGVRDFADRLTRAGHTVHLPDLYEGQVFETLDEGLGYAGKAGFEEIMERGRRVADDLPSGLVYAGFSLGVMPAQLLAQARPGAAGALFLRPVLHRGGGRPRRRPRARRGRAGRGRAVPLPR